jgi:hypothetical protein
MMDEIKQIIEMIAKLPQLAIWVLVAFWAYKVIVIGSVYGVIRFVAEKAYAWAVTPKHETHIVDVRGKLDRMTIHSPDFLIGQISRIIGKRMSIPTPYLHDESIEWLREAIDEKEARDREAKVRA